MAKKKPDATAARIIARSRANESNHPVTTARYVVEFVLNEEDPHATNAKQIKALAAEIQKALDAGYLEEIRYDAIDFDVISRTVLDVAPAGNPKEKP